MVLELQSYFEPAEPGQKIRRPARVCAYPSGCWDKLVRRAACGELDLPFAFAFAFRARRHDAGRFILYRSGFKPSKQLDRPYAMRA